MDREKKPTLWRKIRQFWVRLEIKDRILLIIMTILMVQTGLILLRMIPGLENNDGVDVVVRTTTASIFGYFLGSAFLKTKAETPSQEEIQRQHQQLILVGVLGIAALVLFLLGRNYALITDNDHSTMSQLRDLISSSVGMLIGYSPNR